MNRYAFRIVAWALIGLHLTDALLISGGSWLASYAHSHTLGCGSHCCHHEAGRHAAAKQTKKTSCGHHHHQCAEQQPIAKTERGDAGRLALSLSPVEPPSAHCDSCAACRHERQSLQIASAIVLVAMHRLVVAEAPTSHPTPVLRVARGFDSRGPPAVAL
jgi:hypothetical protein